MKIVILNSRERFRQEDLKKLDQSGAVFYETEDTKLEEVKELYGEEPIVLGVQPSYISGSWDGLPWEKLQKLKQLKGICLSTTAYGWAPFMELKKKGVVVTNVPGKSTIAVAEYYIWMMVALLRKIPLIVKNGWVFEYGPNLLGSDAEGLTAGIVGLGKIGTRIAEFCKGYNMKVIYWSRSRKETSFIYSSLEDLFREADVVFLTTVADESTKGLITNNLIDSMKASALILSPIDPIVFDKNYILKKVAEGELGGFGWESGQEKTSDFKGNVLAAPEVGYYTKQTLANESRIMTEAILSIIEGKPRYAVNL